MRILVVEDEHKIANAIRRGLEQESYAVDVAYDSDEGLSSALTGEHDLIVLDRMLPGLIEGVDICKEVRAHQIHTPIIMLTAKGLELDVARLADEFRVNAVIAKPFSPRELVATIRMHMDPTASLLALAADR